MRRDRGKQLMHPPPPLMLKILHDTPTHKSAEINQSYLIAFICILQETFDVLFSYSLETSWPPDFTFIIFQGEEGVCYVDSHFG